MGILKRFALEGKSAIVTGGTKGLGKAMAEALADAGAQVAVISRHADEATAVAAELSTQYGTECTGHACDVTDEAQVTTTVAQIAEKFGQIDILVNNAGINIRGSIDSLSLAEFTQVQAINVTGPWLMCRAVAPHMLARGAGRVINIGSTLSIIALADRTPYASSKGGILQLSRALALEWAPHGITVNTVMPGPFATEMNTSLLEDPESYKQFVAKIPLGRWGELEEIQGLIVFLAGDASSYITGAGITIDGGWTVH